MELTALFASGSKGSGVPSASSRAMWFLTAPPMAVKEPPISIFPAGSIACCNSMELTTLFAFGLKSGSRAPDALRRAMWFLAVPPMAVNDPPMSIFPSGCTAMELTSLFAFGLKSGSRVPDALRRAIGSCSSPDGGNDPPMSIFPSGCTAMELTSLFAFGLKSGSRVPDALRRAMWFLAVPPMAVNDRQ